MNLPNNMAKKKQKTIRRKRIKKEKNGLLKFLFLAGFLILLFGALWYESQNKNILTIASEIASSTPRKSLQIETFGLPAKTTTHATITPTRSNTRPPTATVSPGPAVCSPSDSGIPIDYSNTTCVCTIAMIHCVGGACVGFDPGRSTLPNMNTSDPCAFDATIVPGPTIDHLCSARYGVTRDGWYCLGKPVIYLYPTYTMLVDVKVTTPGEIVVSDPFYPDGGWKNVLAQPSGELMYEGKNYKELFYESNIKDVKGPLHGLTLSSKNLRQELSTILTQLGLIDYERQEFIDFWTPKLEALHTPYVFFSVISPSEKERIDHVDISPKPDTMIEFIAYFKPLLLPFSGPELVLPTTPPERIGFTAVEWGGTIEN